jgi:hypothetical protein
MRDILLVLERLYIFPAAARERAADVVEKVISISNARSYINNPIVEEFFRTPSHHGRLETSIHQLTSRIFAADNGGSVREPVANAPAVCRAAPHSAAIRAC